MDCRDLDNGVALMLADKKRPSGGEHEQTVHLPLLADASLGCIDSQ